MHRHITSRDIRDIPRPGTPLVDIGVNLTMNKFPDKEGVVQRAAECHVNHLIVTATYVQEAEDALRLCARFPGKLWCTAGVHPHDEASDWQAATNTDTVIARLEEAAQNEHCVAIGEIGLDFTYKTPKDVQKEMCLKQVQLACKLQMPLFMHERKAQKDLMEILSELDNLPLVCIHCFTGTREEAEIYIKAGFYVGVTGHILKQPRGSQIHADVYSCIKYFEACSKADKDKFMNQFNINKSKWRELRSLYFSKSIGSSTELDVRYEHIYRSLQEWIEIKLETTELRRFMRDAIPLDRLMIETDAPYQGFGEHDNRCPHFENYTNEPCTLPIVAEAIAEAYGVDAEVVARVTTANSQRFFRRFFGVHGPSMSMDVIARSASTELLAPNSEDASLAAVVLPLAVDELRAPISRYLKRAEFFKIS